MRSTGKFLGAKIIVYLECHVCRGKKTNTDFGGNIVKCSRCYGTGKVEKRVKPREFIKIFFEGF